jgi:hypothetical protein
VGRDAATRLSARPLAHAGAHRSILALLACALLGRVKGCDAFGLGAPLGGTSFVVRHQSTAPGPVARLRRRGCRRGQLRGGGDEAGSRRWSGEKLRQL